VASCGAGHKSRHAGGRQPHRPVAVTKLAEAMQKTLQRTLSSQAGSFPQETVLERTGRTGLRDPQQKVSRPQCGRLPGL
jgi:hypothetical protein